MFWLHVYICTTYPCLGPIEARTGCELELKLVTDDHEPLCGCLESNPNPLEKKPVLLTAESSLLSNLIILMLAKEIVLQEARHQSGGKGRAGRSL